MRLAISRLKLSWRYDEVLRHPLLPTIFGGSPALLIVDMISDFEFDDADALFGNALKILEPLSALKRVMRARGTPVIYVNDELGHGSDQLRQDIDKLRVRSERASKVLDVLAPESTDHWIVKPQRSGFYATRLGNLLLSLNVSSVVVAGLTTDICVFFTAHDAYMRGYSLWIPSNCCAAVESSHHDDALNLIRRVAHADTTPVDRRLLRSRTRKRTSGVAERQANVIASTLASIKQLETQSSDVDLQKNSIGIEAYNRP